MSDFISGNDLLKRWDIVGFELFEYVRAGKLEPLDSVGRPLLHPDIPSSSDLARIRSNLSLFDYDIDQQRDDLSGAEADAWSKSVEAFKPIANHLRNIMIQSFQNDHARYKAALSRENFGWKGCDLPEDTGQAEKMLSLIVDALYLREDVEQVEMYAFKATDTGKGILDDQSRVSRKKLEVDRFISANPDLIQDIGAEAEIIYRHIVKEVGVTDKSINSRIERKKAALAYYQMNREHFCRISEKHLGDPDIFDFKSEQTKRDYMRRLLKVVLEDLFPSRKFPGDKLYSAFKSTMRQKLTNLTDQNQARK